MAAILWVFFAVTDVEQGLLLTELLARTAHQSVVILKQTTETFSIHHETDIKQKPCI